MVTFLHQDVQIQPLCVILQSLLNAYPQSYIFQTPYDRNDRQKTQIWLPQVKIQIQQSLNIIHDLLSCLLIIMNTAISFLLVFSPLDFSLQLPHLHQNHHLNLYLYPYQQDVRLPYLDLLKYHPLGPSFTALLRLSYLLWLLTLPYLRKYLLLDFVLDLVSPFASLFLNYNSQQLIILIFKFEFRAIYSMNSQSSQDEMPQYESFENTEDQNLLMSRMNWITYLRVIFDKLQNQLQTNKIEIEHIIDALTQIKTLLPLLPRSEYEEKQRFEKGISVFEVQMNLKNYKNFNSEQEVCWDDIIDIFVLGNKKQIISHNTGGLSHTAFTSDNNFIFSPLDQTTSVKGKSQATSEDMVNISGECDINEGDSVTKIKSTIFKEYRAGRIGDQESERKNEEDSLSMMLRGRNPFGENEGQEEQLVNLEDSSPGVEMICKKIEFKDTSVKKTKILNYGVSMIDQVDKCTTERRSESRNTLGNQNCSFYLTPSSGNMTPSQLQDQIKSNELSFSIADQESKEITHGSNKKAVFNYNIPFESVKNSPPLKQKRLIPVEYLCCSIHQDTNYYDINYSNQKAVSSMQLPIVKRDNTQTLRGINLSRNMFSRLYLLHPMQQKQLLILNMQNNLIQTISGIEYCSNLQFLNLSNNMITDISPISNLKYLQEVYFSHNLLSSLLIRKQSDDRGEIDSILSIFTIWPYLEVLDLSYNKLNDFEEVLQLTSGMALRKEIVKIISVKGNSFYNFSEANFTSIDFNLESKDVIEQFSEYYKYPELFKICFASEESHPNPIKDRTKTSLSSLNLNSLTRFQTKSENFTGTLLKDIKKEIKQSKTRLEMRTNKENLLQNKTNKSQSMNRGNLVSDRPITSCYQSQQLTFSNKFRMNSCRQDKIVSKVGGIKNEQSKQTKLKQQSKILQNNKEKNPNSNLIQNIGNTARSLKSSLNKNFRKQVDILSSSLSLKNKEPVINCSILEKPLSRNVKFMNLMPSGETEISQIVNDNRSQLSMAPSSISKFKIGNCSGDTSQRESLVSSQNQMSSFNHHYYGGKQNLNFNSINTYLKKSIDINLSFNPNQLLSSQALTKTKPVTTKHSSSNSVYQFNRSNCSPFSTSQTRQNNESRQTCLNRLSIKSMDLSLSNDLIPRKLKHTSPLKQIQLRERQESKLQQYDQDETDQSFNQIAVPDEKETFPAQSARDPQKVKYQTFAYGQKSSSLIKSLKALNDQKKSKNFENKNKKSTGGGKMKGVQHNQPYQLPKNKRII